MIPLQRVVLCKVIYVTPCPRVHDIVLFGRSEGSLSPSRLCFSLGCARKNASYTTREGTPYEPSSGCSLKWCGTLGLLPQGAFPCCVWGLFPNATWGRTKLWGTKRAFRPPKEDNIVHKGAGHDNLHLSTKLFDIISHNFS